MNYAMFSPPALIAVALVAALGIAVWAIRFVMRETGTIHALNRFEGMHFEN